MQSGCSISVLKQILITSFCTVKMTWGKRHHFKAVLLKLMYVNDYSNRRQSVPACIHMQSGEKLNGVAYSYLSTLGWYRNWKKLRGLLLLYVMFCVMLCFVLPYFFFFFSFLFHFCFFFPAGWTRAPRIARVFSKIFVFVILIKYCKLYCVKIEDGRWEFEGSLKCNILKLI